MRKSTTGRAALAALVSCLASATSSAAEETEIAYPIVFTRVADLEQLGLSLDWPPPERSESALPRTPHFKNGCYLYYGQDRDHLISVSDAFLDRYKARGFSRESLCLGLISEARFDPETGRRLPTYVLRDDAELDRHLERLDPARMSPEDLANYVPAFFKTRRSFEHAIEQLKRREFGNLSDDQVSILVPPTHHTYELPLKLPDCFKNGTPMLDCTWTYGLKSGRKLSAQAPRRYREAGEIADRILKAYIASGQGRRPYDPADATYQEAVAKRTYLLIDRLVAVPEPEVKHDQPWIVELPVSSDLAEWATPVAWYVTSPALPRGYGYALYAWSAFAESGGPAVSAAGLLTAFDGRLSSTRISPGRLIKVLD